MPAVLIGSAVKYKGHASISRRNDSSVSSASDRSAVKFKAHAQNEDSVSSSDRSVVDFKEHAANGSKISDSSVENIDRSVMKRKRHALNGRKPRTYSFNSIDRSAVKHKGHTQNGGILKRYSLNSIDESEVNLDAPNRSESTSGSCFDSIDRSVVRHKAHAPNMKMNDSRDGIIERSAAKSVAHPPAPGLANGDNYTMAEEEDKLNSCINSRVSSCTYLGKSKCYKVDKRYLDYLFNEETHIAQGSDGVIYIDV